MRSEVGRKSLKLISFYGVRVKWPRSDEEPECSKREGINIKNLDDWSENAERTLSHGVASSSKGLYVRCRVDIVFVQLYKGELT